jgi:Tol biopolymer transport system component
MLLTDVAYESVTLLVADAPDFAAAVINAEDVRYPRVGLFAQVATWTPDGQSVVFSGIPADDSGVFIYSDVWLMDKNGLNPYPVNPGETASRDLEFVGWMDDQTLVYESYHGGGSRSVRVLDIYTGENLAEAGTNGYFHHPTANYFVGTNSWSGGYTLVVSRWRQPTEHSVTFRPYVIYGPPYEFGVEYPASEFQDWLPGTNKMLLQMFSYDIHGREYAPVSELLLWDLDAGTLSLLAPDGLNGRFSPDGRYLAYLTLGSPRLDAEGRPVSTRSEPKDPLLPRHLQLLDMQSGQVVLSLSISDDERAYKDGPFVYRPHIAFSPDSRYLAFVTPGQVRLDADGWPVGVDSDVEGQAYLNVLDLASGEVNLLAPGGATTPDWSPTSDKLVYSDPQGHLAFLNVEDGHSTPITQSGEERLLDLQWSFDGQYISLNFREDEIWRSQLFVLRVP